MTSTQQFIEDAIKGGWGSKTSKKHGAEYTVSTIEQFMLHEILLDPLAWQAVGKARGLEDCSTCQKYKKLCGIHARVKWHSNMIYFIDHLAEGRSIEEALSLIA